MARRAFLIGLGVTARFTARPGCAARRTLRGMNNLEKKPTLTPSSAGPLPGALWPRFPHSHRVTIGDALSLALVYPAGMAAMQAGLTGPADSLWPMPITPRTRKILWVKAGGRCSICGEQLATDAAGNDDPSVIGEECHIVARSPGGARAADIADIDGYDNLILLCRKHHKQVDDQRSHFTVERLKKIKREHERREASRDSEPPPARRPAASRRKSRPQVLSPSPPDITQDPRQPLLELGLRGRLLLTGPEQQAQHITAPARSATLDALNNRSPHPPGLLKALMNTWYSDTWRAEPWQLVAPSNAREANARWRGIAPEGGRVTEARLSLKLTQDPARADSLTVTVHSLLINPYRPSLMDELEAMAAKWGIDTTGPGGLDGIFQAADRAAAEPAASQPTYYSFLTLRGLRWQMLEILSTLWGPLGEELSTHIFGQSLGPPAQLDLTVFTFPDWKESGIPLNDCINFGAARLIDGATPGTCTLLDPIRPDIDFYEDGEQEKAVHAWLSQLCLDNGFRDFEPELIPDTQD
jgi:hypothetical protein